MLDELHVENLALIRSASLAPCMGLTVLTGETGAGKTALLSACKLLMGERADKGLVRDGEGALVVSGRLFGTRRADNGGGGAAERDGAAAGDDADEGLVAVRRVSADGRSRVTVDGAPASVGDLARLVAPTIDLCGQHEHQQLMRPATHVALLDAWAGDAVAGPRAGFSGGVGTPNTTTNEP